jgi:hypothetical protein
MTMVIDLLVQLTNGSPILTLWMVSSGVSAALPAPCAFTYGAVQCGPAARACPVDKNRPQTVMRVIAARAGSPRHFELDFGFMMSVRIVRIERSLLYLLGG